MTKECLNCGSTNLGKAIYYGIPHKYCYDCETLMANCITWYLPFSDNTMTYTTAYPIALLYWLFGNWRKDE